MFKLTISQNISLSYLHIRNEDDESSYLPKDAIDYKQIHTQRTKDYLWNKDPNTSFERMQEQTATILPSPISSSEVGHQGR